MGWVNSYSINYPTSIKYIFCVIQFFICLWMPGTVFSLLFFPFLSIYFWFKGKYKDILIIWGIHIVSSYLLFTGLLIGFEGNILIGREYTNVLLGYVVFEFENSPLLMNYCVQTIISFEIISKKLGVIIYIPSIFKGVLFVVKFIFGGSKGGPSVWAAPEKGSRPPSPGVSPTDIKGDDTFNMPASSSPKPSNKDIVYTDYLDQCKAMRDSLRQSRKWYEYKNTKCEQFKGNKYLTVYELRMPIINYIFEEGCNKGSNPKL